MQILITGAGGFVAKNLIHRLSTMPDVHLLTFTRENSLDDLLQMARRADCIFHLAGVNRPPLPEQFMEGNLVLTQALCSALRPAPKNEQRMVIYTSSIQAVSEHPYGQSKRAAEAVLRGMSEETGIKVLLYRLPNVFGRWSRPNYNSAVATFCHNIARGLPIKINDPAAELTLVHVDDVVESFVSAMRQETLPVDAQGFAGVIPQYKTTVGEVARWIHTIHEEQALPRGAGDQAGLVSALFDTYQSMAR